MDFLGKADANKSTKEPKRKDVNNGTNNIKLHKKSEKWGRKIWTT